MKRRKKQFKPQLFDLTVDYAPDQERMLEALMVALGLSTPEIRSMLAARRKQERNEALNRSSGVS